MKRILICVLVLILFLTGCNNKKIINNENMDNKKEVTNNKKDAYNKNEDTLDNFISKDINGLKTYMVYKGNKGLTHNELDDTIYEIRLLLTEDNNYYMDHGSFAGNVSFGTYKIDNDKLILNQKYILGSNCSSKDNIKEYIFNIKNGNIIASIDNIYDIELKISEERFGYSILFDDTCEIKIKDNKEYKLYKKVFAYNDSDYEIELQFLPFDNYLLTYCNTKNCYSSVGTYSYNSENIILNQTKYQGNDVCYYYQDKEYILSYSGNNINDIVPFNNIVINLKGIDGFTDKNLVLKENVKTYLDNLYYSEDFFGVYCGRK